MRLWSLEPALLDRAALVACWREALLAQKVLAGNTRGYTRHPQLERFRECADPLDAIGYFLADLQREATARGYRFDITRILRPSAANPHIAVTTGQLAYERDWLRTKVSVRDPAWLDRLAGEPRCGTTFVLVEGPIAAWERVTPL